MPRPDQAQLRRTTGRALAGGILGVFAGFLLLDALSVRGDLQGASGLISLAGYAGLSALGLAVALGLPAALAARAHLHLADRRGAGLIAALIIAPLPALGIAWALGRLLRATHFAERSWWELAVRGGQGLVFVGVVLAAALAIRHVRRGSGAARRTLAVLTLGGMAYGLALADRRLFVRHYPDLHLVLGGLALAAAGFAGAILGSTVFRRLPGRLFLSLIALVGAAALAAGFGFLPDHDPRVARLVGVEAPLASKVVTLLPRRVAAGDGRVDAAYLGALRAQPRLAGYELDALFPERRNFNVVFISIDTLRADHVGALGYERETTPRLDAFGRECVTFSNAFAQYPSSQLSMASMFSGRYPSATRAHRVRDGMNRIPEAAGDVMLVHRMRDAGRTARAVTALPPGLIDRLFGHLRDGHEVFRDAGGDQYKPADVVTQRAIATLPDATEGPHYTWVHYFDPHQPYQSHAGTPRFGDRALDLYDEEIRFADAHIGRLLDHLRTRPDWDRTVVVIHSDHGEEFRDHGGLHHHSSVYREQLHVPLFLRIPSAPALRIERPVELIDIVPTLCALLDLPAAGPPFQGHDLLPLLLSDAPDDPLLDHEIPALAWSQIIESTPGTGRQESLRSRDWTLVHRIDLGLDELYDRRRDPAEKRNQSLAQPEALAEMRRWRAAFRAFARDEGEDRPTTEEIPRQEALRLRALDADIAIALPAIAELERSGFYRVLEAVNREILADPERGPLHTRAMAWLVRERVAGIEKLVAKAAESPRGDLQIQALRNIGRLGLRDEHERLMAFAAAPESWPGFAALTSRAMIGDDSVAEDVLEAFFRVRGHDRFDPLAGLAALGREPAYGLLHGAVAGSTLPWSLDTVGLELLARSKRPEALFAYHTRLVTGRLERVSERALPRAISGFSLSDALPVMRGALGARTEETRRAIEERLRREGYADRLEVLLTLEESVRGAAEIAGTGKTDEALAGLGRADTAARAVGIVDWGLAIETWRHLYTRGRSDEAAAYLESRPSGDPAFAAAHLKRLAAIARGRRRPARGALSWLYRDQKLLGPTKAWFGGVQLTLDAEGGSLSGADAAGLATLHIELIRQSDPRVRHERRIELPVGGVLPGESLPIMVGGEFNEITEGAWTLNLVVRDGERPITPPLSVTLTR